MTAPLRSLTEKADGRRFFLQPGFLRLVLAFLVVVQHFSRFDFGGWAVSVFFVLSGYWVSRMFTEKYVHARRPWWTFIESRYLRLFPVYAVCLIVAAVAFSVWHILPDYVGRPFWWIRTLAFVGTIGQGQIVGPFWSLDIEFQFYLLAPAVVLFAKRLTARSTLALGAALAAFTIYCCLSGISDLTRPTQKWVAYYSGFFFAGVAIHRLNYQPSAKHAGVSFAMLIIGAAAAVAFPATRGIFLWGYDAKLLALNPAVSAVGAFVALPFVAFVLSKRSSAQDLHFGNFSYALYCFHFVPWRIYYSVYGSLPSRERIGPLSLSLITVLVGSLVVYWLVDRPCESFRKRFTGSRT